jgi:hypothetical protein
LSFFEPGKGQFFWLWLKKAQNGSKKLKTAQKSSQRLKKAQNGSKKLKTAQKSSEKLKKFELTNPCIMFFSAISDKF